MGPFATHRLLVRIALSAAHIFAWLFIFQYFYYISDAYVPALVSTVVSYALAQILATMLTPLTAARLRKGIRGLLVNALLALSAAFAPWGDRVPERARRNRRGLTWRTTMSCFSLWAPTRNTSGRCAS